MDCINKICVCLSTIVVAQWFAATAAGQHFDVQVQSVASKLTTGAADFDGGSFTLGLRVWSRFLSSSFVNNNPGFDAIGTEAGTVPPGSEALPGNVNLLWDFVPMKVGAVKSNLLYWNGAGTTPADVSFGLPPTSNYSLSLFGKNNARVAADGTDQLIPGQTIDTTAADGFLHVHRFFFLDNDHDDNNATVAPAGVYLISMRLRMAGLDRADPYYIAFGTTGTTATALQAAATWVTDRVDQLAPNYDADFDGDLDVDGADFLTWQRNLGMTGALQIHGDSDRNRAIGGGDLVLWKSEFGSSLANFAGAQSFALTATPVPEPTGFLLVFLAVAISIGALKFTSIRSKVR